MISPHPKDISLSKGGKKYKTMTQKKEELAEQSLEIANYDRAVVVKLNWKGWVTNVTEIATGFGSKGK